MSVNLKSDLFVTVTFNYILDHLNKDWLYKCLSVCVFEMWFILLLHLTQTTKTSTAWMSIWKVMYVLFYCYV